MKEPDFEGLLAPTVHDIEKAHLRIKNYIHKTPIISSEIISKDWGFDVVFKMESFQKAGSFKSRGASNAVKRLLEKGWNGCVATHSSGNHAQALARVASYFGLKAIIVMPEDAPQVKINAVRQYGGQITFCTPTIESRELTLKAILENENAVEIHPYNNIDVMAGQATCAKEIIEDWAPNVIIAPVGGGGLLSGTALSANYFCPNVPVIGAEPVNVNDAFLSLEQGELLFPKMKNTIADGLKTYLGDLSFPIIKKNVKEIVCVEEDDISRVMKYFWERTKCIIEPSSAVALAAAEQKKLDFKNKKVAIIVSGGNVDLNNLQWIKKGN